MIIKNFFDWTDFKEYATEEYSEFPLFLFRGQQDSNWDIISTLTRLNKETKIPPENFEYLQSSLFRKRIRGLRGPSPQPLDDIELWCLGQHFGLATPLIDWTETLYIAVYFAFEQPSKEIKYRSVYALDYVSLQKELKERGLEWRLFEESTHDGNARVIAQSGVFSRVPTGMSMEDWLLEHDLSKYLVKLNIPNEYRREILNDLRLMNIEHHTIYPDLHGAAISCNMHYTNIVGNINHIDSFNKRINEMKENGVFRKLDEADETQTIS